MQLWNCPPRHPSLKYADLAHGAGNRWSQNRSVKEWHADALPPPLPSYLHACKVTKSKGCDVDPRFCLRRGLVFLVPGLSSQDPWLWDTFGFDHRKVLGWQVDGDDGFLRNWPSLQLRPVLHPASPSTFGSLQRWQDARCWQPGGQNQNVIWAKTNSRKNSWTTRCWRWDLRRIRLWHWIHNPEWAGAQSPNPPLRGQRLGSAGLWVTLPS